MGQLIAQTAEAQGHAVLGMADAMDLSALENGAKPDMIIDFSHRDNLDWILGYALKNNIAVVYGTTGLDDGQKESLFRAAESIPVFFSSNFSYGVAVMQELIRRAVPLLKDSFDMELIETHHNQKQDAPSGTAKTILEIMDPDGEYSLVYGRQGMTGRRGKEIGVHALRGGTEAGEHTVKFFGNSESITITHHAASRQIFVNGALKAAEFLLGRKPGLYGMKDLTEE